MRSDRLFRSIAATALYSLFTLAFAVAAQPYGETLETGWLELVKGSRDSTMGAQLIEIEQGDTADEQKITLAIPKKSLADPGAIEEVLVIGQRLPATEKSRPIKIQYEWVSDHDPDNYGLIIRLGKNTNWPIRLYMNSEPGFRR
jgi:hypothetical protein